MMPVRWFFCVLPPEKPSFFIAEIAKQKESEYGSFADKVYLLPPPSDAKITFAFSDL